MVASACIDMAQVKRPGLSDADGLTLLNIVHDEILSQVGLQLTTVDTTTLSATSLVYDLSTTVRKVWWCRYQLSATTSDYIELKPTTRDALEYENYLSNDGTPPELYFTTHKDDGTLQIGVHPYPAASTGSPAYPRLITRVTVSTPLTVTPDDSELPIGLPSYKAWWRGVVAYWDELKGHPDKAESYALYQKAVQELLTWKQTQNAKVLPSAAPYPSYHYPTRV